MPTPKEIERKTIREAIAALPDDVREGINEDRRARRRNWQRNKNERTARQRRLIELILNGYTRVEVAEILGISKQWATTLAAELISLPHQGSNKRYIAVPISVENLAALDRLCGHILGRQRALELIVAANMEDDGAVARRTLRVSRSAP